MVYYAEARNIRMRRIPTGVFAAPAYYLVKPGR